MLHRLVCNSERKPSMSKRSIVWLLGMGGLLIAEAAYGQCGPSNNLSGALRVRPATGCVPLTVRAGNSQAIAKNIRHIFMYDGRDESKTTTDTVFTYTKPGIYYVLQLSDADGKPARACAIITVQDTLPPPFVYTTCGNLVTLIVNMAPPANYDGYRIDWGDGTSEDVLPEQAKSIKRTYTTAGTHRVRVSGQFLPSRCGGTSTQQITHGAAPVLPTISGLFAQGSSLVVPLLNPGLLTFYAEKRVGSEPYQRASPTLSVPMTSLFTTIDSTKLICFRLIMVDTCITKKPLPEVCYFPPPSATVTVPPSATVTVPPSATVTVPPSATVTVPPSATITVPPSATVTQPPSPTVSVPPSATVTVPPSPTVTVPPSVTTAVIPASPETNWFFPTAFTPNNDGVNDSFGPVGMLPVVMFRLVIFDRWGIAIFDTTDSVTGWDGRTINGALAPPGPYPYRADWQENADNQRSWRGSVLLLR